jgi:hypothetical protein
MEEAPIGAELLKQLLLTYLQYSSSKPAHTDSLAALIDCVARDAVG